MRDRRQAGLKINNSITGFADDSDAVVRRQLPELTG